MLDPQDPSMIPEQVLRGTQNAADITVGRPSRGLIVLLSTGSMRDGLVHKPAGVCTMGDMRWMMKTGAA
jgi:hypothetical protein